MQSDTPQNLLENLPKVKFSLEHGYQDPRVSGRSPLVTTHISQQKSTNVDLFELYPVSVRIVRQGPGGLRRGGGIRKEIKSFSWASKRRLRFSAANANPALISQFGMTYHKTQPGGRKVKKDLNTFLTAIRRAYPCMGYLWIIEFQKRGTVHVHLWLTEPVSYGLHQFLAGRWNQIAESVSDDHLWWHLREENFIPWKMRSAGYLCKYVDKEHQKRVPEGFSEVGRFWGCSRGLVGVPDVVSSHELDCYFAGSTPKASKSIVRIVCKADERKKRWKHFKTNGVTVHRNRARRSRQNANIFEGRASYDRLIEYYRDISSASLGD